MVAVMVAVVVVAAVMAVVVAMVAVVVVVAAVEAVVLVGVMRVVRGDRVCPRRRRWRSVVRLARWPPPPRTGPCRPSSSGA